SVSRPYCAAITSWPSARRAGISFWKHEPSAQIPWAKTMLGLAICNLRTGASPKVLIEKFACSSVRQHCRGGVVVSPDVSGKRMALTRIAVNGCVRLFGQRSLDLRLRLLRDELVLLAKVHQ